MDRLFRSWRDAHVTDPEARESHPIQRDLGNDVG